MGGTPKLRQNNFLLNSIIIKHWHPKLSRLISGRVDRASTTEAIDFGSIPGRVIPKTKNWYSQLSCLTLSIKRDSAKPPPCVVDRLTGGSLTRRPKGPFAVSWPKQLGKLNVIAIKITITIQKIDFFGIYLRGPQGMAPPNYSMTNICPINIW